MNSRNTSSVFRLLSEFRASFIKDLLSYFRQPAWVLGEFIGTPLWFFFFALGVTIFVPSASAQDTSAAAGEVAGYSFFLLGFVFIILFSTSVWGMGQSVRNEQEAGTLEQFFLAPASRVTLIVGRWARIFLTDAIIIGYTTAFLYLTGGSLVTLADPIVFLGGLALFEAALIGFGLLFAGMTLRIKSYNTIGNLVFFSYMFICGTLFPITVIPFPFRYISLAVPFTYFIDLMRHAALSTPTILPENIEYIVSLLLSVSMLVVGLIAFKKIEANARKQGSIATS